jgi:hypothetical protein
MPIAWFICPYKRGPNIGLGPSRYCAMDDFTNQIITDGGTWSETEILGNHAIVKVRASDVTLTKIADGQGFVRMPKAVLTEPLSDLGATAKTSIRNKLTALGYSLSEVRNALGDDLGSKTLADVLRFAAKRRLKPRYDKDTDTIILDGPEHPVRPIEDVDKAVK